ncbi:MAG: YqiJ family protein [Acidobacteria bacterium]|nr:YqiJ family protein [Acidobacteriota bacterium]
MAPSIRRPVLAGSAMVLDALAIALLAADVLAAFDRDIPALLVLSVTGIPIALAGAVTSGIHLARRISRVPRRIVVIGAVAATIAAVRIGGAAIAVAFGATPNPAASAEDVVGRTVEAEGGRRLCGSGDPGLGPDDLQPYSFALSEVPAGVDVRPVVIAQAGRLGWTVSADLSDDVTRTGPRPQIDQGGRVDIGACGTYHSVERASAGMRLLQLEVLLPHR